MEVVSRVIERKTRSVGYRITFLGDEHLGGRDCDKKLLKNCVSLIESDPYHYWVGMGDPCEYINYTDKRFDASELDPEILELKDLNDLPRVQTNAIADILAPIKSQCLGLAEGNHCNTIERKYHQRVHSILCEALQHKAEWPLDLGYSAIIKLKLNRISEKRVHDSDTIKIYVHHGFGGGRKKGAKVNRMQDLALYFPYCQIFVAGHTHDRFAFIDDALDAKERADELYDIHRGYGNSGTFKRTYQQGTSGYGERAQYPPTSLGCITFSIDFTENGYNIGAHCSTSGLPFTGGAQ
jgi:hypothetical protein